LTAYRVSRESSELLGWVSPFDFGEKNGEGVPVRANTNDWILAHARPSFRGVRGRNLDRRMLDEHAEEVRTLYITSRAGARRMFLCIDVDNHGGRGTLDDAIRYSVAAIAKYCGGVAYYETSTHGRGVHIYFFMDSTGDPAKDARAIRRLERDLDYFRQDGVNKGLWVVDRVEIKGKPGHFVRNRAGMVVDYHAGTLIKAPRGFRARFDELRNTAVLSAADILAWPVPAKPDGYDDNQACGSAGGNYFGPEEIARLKPGGAYYELAKRLLGIGKFYCGKRLPLQIEDMAIFLMILRRFHRNRNADRTMPTRRWEMMWTALYDSGDIGRRWNRQRFQGCRDYLSGKNQSGVQLLDWEETLYIAGIDREDAVGEYRKQGTACKWGASELLSYSIEEAVKTKKAVAVGEPLSLSPKPATPAGLSLNLGEGTADCTYNYIREPATIPFPGGYPRPRFAGFVHGRRLQAA